MHWTFANFIIVGVGALAVVGGITMFRHRATLRRFFIRMQTRMYGFWVGNQMEQRTTPMTAVGVPAIGFVIIGCVFIVAGIFGEPRVT
ncbi:MAG TPA: hypothetical protein VFT01_06605 [Homoserinimonas sp.]|nr:hypothetical protein [Homoserinimonas sp.]